MKKTLQSILMIAPIFQDLSRKHYDNFAAAWAVAEALKKIQAQRQFYMDQEKSLVDQYAKRDDKGEIIVEHGNRIKFDKPEDGQSFQESIIKLQNTEIDLGDTFPLKLSPKDFRAGEDILTPEQIMQLDDYVEFVMDKQNHSA